MELARQLYMTEKTNTFRASAHIVRTSDFINRYALYRHLTEEQGRSHEDAWKIISDIFVNYNIPLNRYLQWSNAIGMTFFIKYFVGIQKAALNLVKERPVTVASYLAFKNLIGVDIPSIYDTTPVSGRIFPQILNYDKILNENLIPPGVEILTGKSL